MNQGARANDDYSGYDPVTDSGEAPADAVETVWEVPTVPRRWPVR